MFEAYEKITNSSYYDKIENKNEKFMNSSPLQSQRENYKYQFKNVMPQEKNIVTQMPQQEMNLENKMKNYSGRNFDYNFIDAELNRSNFAPLNQHVTCLLDSLDILRDKTLWDVDKPSSFSLGNLYRYIRAKELDNAHNAMFDVLALAEILESQRLKDKWRKVANNKQFLI